MKKINNIRTAVRNKLVEISHLAAKDAKQYDTTMTWAFVSALD
jgi:hypothetical protein